MRRVNDISHSAQKSTANLMRNITTAFKSAVWLCLGNTLVMIRECLWSYMFKK